MVSLGRQLQHSASRHPAAPFLISSPNHRESSCQESGATIVEFAIAVGLFFCLLVVGFDFIRWSYQSDSTQYLATSVLRAAVVGPSQRPLKYGSQALWIEGELIAQAASFGIALRPQDIAICSFRTLNASGTCNPSSDDGGSAGDVIAVQVNAPLSGFLWGTANLLSRGLFNVNALAVARNEPWDG